MAEAMAKVFAVSVCFRSSKPLLSDEGLKWVSRCYKVSCCVWKRVAESKLSALVFWCIHFQMQSVGVDCGDAEEKVKGEVSTGGSRVQCHIDMMCQACGIAVPSNVPGENS